MNNLKILFKYPSRGRSERFFRCLDTIYGNVAGDNYFIWATLDKDDPAMFNDAVMQQISDRWAINGVYGLSEGKIHAVNRDMDRLLKECPDWDICVVMSDDMEFILHGFDNVIRETMQEVFPDLDGLLHFPDQDAKHHLNTMLIVGRKYYERFNYLYHPSYKSLFADNESMEVAQLLGKYHYNPTRMFNHLLPAMGHLPKDQMFNEQQALWGVDEANFLLRKAINFGIE